jgi:nucleoside-diphosphate-sugar epimerase
MMESPLLLTGASGWFGRTALWAYEQEHGPEALRREVIPFASRERLVEFDSPAGPVRALPLEAIHQVQNPAGLLHLAFLTRDKVEELGWQQYVDSNRAITAHVARVLQAWPTMPVVTTSSGAAAALDGKPPDLEGNPYATLKQEEEVLLERESATRMAMVFRVYAASGRFMTRPEKFALGDFLMQAMRGEPIQIRSCCEVVRSYVPISTLMQLVWPLFRGGVPAGFQRVNACTVTTSVRELAQRISERYGLPVCPYALDSADPPDRYSADPAEFLSWLARNGVTAGTFLEQIEETALGLEQQAGSSLARRDT